VSTVCYEQLALEWSPAAKSDRQFKLFALLVALIMMLGGVLLSMVPVPERERESTYRVPERIANFMVLKKKAEPEKKVVKPKPKPKPKPVPKEKTRVKKEQVKQKVEKPLTKSQQNAREKAAKSGLLALASELSDLMDTSDISGMVGGDVKSGSAAAAAAATTGVSSAFLTEDASKGSGGVGEDKYTAVAQKSQLSQREITQVKQSLLSPELQPRASSALDGKQRSGTERAAEEISIVFDRNKSTLYALYNRARRTNPGLKGRIVLEITISPGGKVTSIKILSSELKDAKLESSLIRRIKRFDFGAKKVEQVIVTYPIEFLPS
jgi:TonB family protein